MNKDEQNWAVFTHLSAYLMFLGVPSILGPLIMWLIKKNEMPFVDDQGKEAVNFHITMWILALISVPLMLIFVGFILFFIILIFDLIMPAIAAISTSNGNTFRYPMTWRLIK